MDCGGTDMKPTDISKMHPYKGDEADFILKEVSYFVGVMVGAGMFALLGYWMMLEL